MGVNWIQRYRREGDFVLAMWLINICVLLLLVYIHVVFLIN